MQLLWTTCSSLSCSVSSPQTCRRWGFHYCVALLGSWQVVVGPGGILFDDRVTPASAPEDIEFREEVFDCFPEADSHLGYPLPEHLPQV